MSRYWQMHAGLFTTYAVAQMMPSKMLDAGVFPQLVNLLMHSSTKVLPPVILALARISAGDDAQVQVLIDHGILNCLSQMLERNYPKNIKKQACLIVSNIAAGSKDQIQAVIDAGIISSLIPILKTPEIGITKEAAWAISNVASGGSSDQIQYLVSRGCLEPMCRILTYQDCDDLVYTCLEGLQNILEAGEAGRKGQDPGTNPYAEFIIQCGGLHVLEDLQDVDNDRIYKLVMELLESYWEEEVSGDPGTPGSTDSAGTTPEDAAAQPPGPSPSGANEAD